MDNQLPVTLHLNTSYLKCIISGFFFISQLYTHLFVLSPHYNVSSMRTRTLISSLLSIQCNNRRGSVNLCSNNYWMNLTVMETAGVWIMFLRLWRDQFPNHFNLSLSKKHLQISVAAYENGTTEFISVKDRI